MRAISEPSHIINLNEQISCFEISANDFSQNLVAVAVEKKIVLGLVKFPEDSEHEAFQWERLKDIYHETRCDALCFAPETSLSVVPKVVTFCAAGADFVLRIFRSDLLNSDTIQKLEGHSSYVNDIAWEHSGDFLASVSDDHTCKVWNNSDNFESVTTFCLSSSGMSVKWHPEEPGKLLVAEKNGIIRMYNARTEQVIMSLESPKSPLMSADWAFSNRLFVTALAGGDLITWDLRRTCRPANVKQVHEDGGRIVRVCPTTEAVLASIGRPDITLKVTSTKAPVPLLEAPIKLCGGICWHSRLPYVGVAYDRRLCFWKVQIK